MDSSKVPKNNRWAFTCIETNNHCVLERHRRNLCLPLCGLGRWKDFQASNYAIVSQHLSNSVMVKVRGSSLPQNTSKNHPLLMPLCAKKVTLESQRQNRLELINCYHAAVCTFDVCQTYTHRSMDLFILNQLFQQRYRGLIEGSFIKQSTVLQVKKELCDNQTKVQMLGSPEASLDLVKENF